MLCAGINRLEHRQTHHQAKGGRIDRGNGQGHAHGNRNRAAQGREPMAVKTTSAGGLALGGDQLPGGAGGIARKLLSQKPVR